MGNFLKPQNLLPMALGAVGAAVGAPYVAGLLGESALTGGIATGLNEAGFALGLPASTAVTQQGVASGIGGLVGGGAGSMVGRGMMKDLTSPEAVPIGSPPSFPNSRGVQAPSFQFQTVGIQPSATIGAQRGGDILELLRRLQTRA